MFSEGEGQGSMFFVELPLSKATNNSDSIIETFPKGIEDFY